MEGEIRLQPRPLVLEEPFAPLAPFIPPPPAVFKESISWLPVPPLPSLQHLPSPTIVALASGTPAAWLDGETPPPAGAEGDDDGLPWWAWLLIALGVVAVAGGGTAAVLALTDDGPGNGTEPPANVPNNPDQCHPDEDGNVPEGCGGEAVGGN